MNQAEPCAKSPSKSRDWLKSESMNCSIRQNKPNRAQRSVEGEDSLKPGLAGHQGVLCARSHPQPLTIGLSRPSFHARMRSFSQNLSLVLAVLFGCFILGCKSTDNTQFADLGFSTTNALDASAPPSSGSAKIVIKGTKAGASQQDIAVALMAATKKLAPKKTRSEERRVGKECR